MKSALTIVACVVGVVALFAFAWTVEINYWHECKAVGHSTFYCLMQHGR